MSVRAKIRNPEAVEDARRLSQAGADVELVLLFLRDRGLDQPDCIYALEALLGLQFSEAKNTVVHSKAWSDQYKSDTQIRDATREALRQLAESKSRDLPDIILKDRKEG